MKYLLYALRSRDGIRRRDFNRNDNPTVFCSPFRTIVTCDREIAAIAFHKSRMDKTGNQWTAHLIFEV